ncbi:hypothetical protein IP70_05560 [alpha proteobacterium AAP38]|nr:hypothetical protein IP70_05560 [alpha proteobacterium AAP38]
MATITLIQGHPDAGNGHLLDDLADAYLDGAAAGGHMAETLRLNALDFPLIRSKQDWEEGPIPPDIQAAQAAILSADHLVFLFPLWLGDVPALMKAFLEQVARPAFLLEEPAKGFASRRRLAGRSTRSIVSMGMPALLYRLYFLSHGVRSFKRNVLGFAGLGPNADTLIGMVDNMPTERRDRLLQRMEALGRARK